MTPEVFLEQAIHPALKLLPAKMTSMPAKAMMVAIALQESRIQYRKQIGGPARGYFQFEMNGGVKEILRHSVTGPIVRGALLALDYDPNSSVERCYVAIEHNDILASVFARLLLYASPKPLPARNAPAAGWTLYKSQWRPGKPHRETWDTFFEQAWDVVA